MRIHCPNLTCIDSRGRRTVLAELVAGYYVVRHARREFVASGMVSIRCERCGAVYVPEARASPARGGEPG